MKSLIKLLQDRVIVKKRQLDLFDEALDLLKHKRKNIKRIFHIANELNPRRVNPRKWTMEELEKILERYEQKLKEKNKQS